MTAVVGPSGEGKTTLLNILAGLMPPSQGVVRFRGKPVPYAQDGPLRRFRAYQVAMVFQELNLLSQLTVLENAAFPLLCQGRRRSEALAAAQANLAYVGLGELLGRRPHQLSRGQKQRVAVARAFTSGAELIAADEPTGSLDPESAQGVMESFRSLASRLGGSVLLVTHDHQLAYRYCDRVLECKGGMVAECWRRCAADQACRPGRTALGRRDSGCRPSLLTGKASRRSPVQPNPLPRGPP